jgi:hypothetical protein
MLISAAVAAMVLSGVSAVRAQPVAGGGTLVAVSGRINGNSPDGLGTWSVQYQRVDGGNPDITSVINEGIDAEAMRQVQQNTWDGSTKHHWTFDATGTTAVRPITVSELFVGQYNTHEPNMPLPTVATIVLDSRSGTRIIWDNLFRDKIAGLTRLSEQTEAILPTVYAPPHPGEWHSSGALAPIDINFKYWIPTAQGIELHFPDNQFGRGLKVITVPWPKVEDLIAPEFLPIVG